MGPIPILLLKTRSQPGDSYEDRFSNPSSISNEDHDSENSPLSFSPQFVPVLEHKFNTETLSHVENLVRTGQLAEQFGGMIFTSQRAVEAFSGIVAKVDAEKGAGAALSSTQTAASSPSPPTQRDGTPTTFLDPYFPLYSVGPATTRSLTPLLHSPTLSSLNPGIYGAHTGTGAKLASFMLRHYNTLHAHRWFTYFEAPRLPFIPLVGPASGTYARRRMEGDDERLRKKGLLFLVGEVRRDVIPVCLGRGWVEREKEVEDVDEERRIAVDELEVYSTGVMESFEKEFGGIVQNLEQKQDVDVAVVVVFSPQGCEAMLRTLGYLDNEQKPPMAREEYATSERRWGESKDSMANGAGVLGRRVRYVVVTIGPTTRDYLRDTFAFEPDVCAEKPSPQGIEEGLLRFLRLRGLV
jgi:uroporphyrinogen-III synthase